MASIPTNFVGGPITHRVASAVIGGQLVQAATVTGAGTLGIPPGCATATAGSATVVGVALDDGIPLGSGFESGTTAYGATFTDVSVPTADIAVETRMGAVVPVTYGAAAGYGVSLKAGANGTVVPWVSGTDAANLIVGQCVQPGGVASASTVGRFKFAPVG